jgi:hypothetical protein
VALRLETPSEVRHWLERIANKGNGAAHQ